MIMPIAPETAAANLPFLKASPDGRQISTASGKTVFLLGDVAWELFHRLDRTEVEAYLADRASKGFNLIHAATLSGSEGLDSPNARGDLPFRERSPAQPNEAFFAHIDWIADRAAARGIYMALAPAMGSGAMRSSLLTPANAAIFGEWLGKRYRERPIIWILNAGWAADSAEGSQLAEALARGLRRGGAGAHLIVDAGGRALSESGSRDDAPWADICGGLEGGASGEAPAFSRAVTPAPGRVKPFLPLSSPFEDAPVGEFAQGGYSNAADVRRPFYANVFSGSCGHVYGHHSVWQFCKPGRSPILDPIMDWREGLQQPGAFQMKIGARLLESRPTARREVDASVVAPSCPVLARGPNRALAMRDGSRRWAMVYVPEGRPCDVRLDSIAAEAVKVWRFDPRSGAAASVGLFPARGIQRFAPPARGEPLDWILVLDDASCGWGVPGSSPSANF